MDALLVFLLLLIGVWVFYGIVTSKVKYSRAEEDEEPLFDDWKVGSPNDPVPENAKPLGQDGTDKLP